MSESIVEVRKYQTGKWGWSVCGPSRILPGGKVCMACEVGFDTAKLARRNFRRFRRRVIAATVHTIKPKPSQLLDSLHNKK